MNQLKYSRIDAGQKRQAYRKAPKIDQERDPRLSTFLPAVSPQERCEIVAKALTDQTAGKSLREIAIDLGCSYEGLRLWMLQEQPDAYKQAIQVGLIARIVYSDKELDDAKSPLDVARARESARFARWDAERRLPHLFGPKQEVTHTLKPEFIVQLKQEPTVIEGQSVPLLDSPSK